MGDGIYNCALSDFLETFRHDSLPRLKTFVNNPKSINALSYLYRSYIHFVVRTQHCNLITALKLCDRPLGHQQRVLDFA